MTTAAFETRRHNLRKLILDKYEGNRAAFARAANVHQNQVNLLLTDNEKHRRNLGEALARKIEEALGLPTEFLDTAHVNGGEPSFDVRATAIPEELSRLLRKADVVACISFYKSHLEAWGPITATENLTVCRVITRDMEPDIAFDSRIILDAGVRAVSRDGVYILQRGTDLFLRRVTKHLDGGWIVQGAGETIRVENLKGIKSVGRIVCLLRETVL